MQLMYSQLARTQLTDSLGIGCGKIVDDEVLAQSVSLYGDVSRTLRRRGGPCLRLPAKL